MVTAARVTAAKFLTEQLSTYAADTGAKLDVAIAGFSDTYSERKGWTRLSKDSLGSLTSTLDGFADRAGGTDTDYWRENAENMHLSASLQGVLMTWLSRKPLIAGLQAGRFGQGYPVVSWYALLAGMGVFPDASELQPPSPHQARHDLAAVDDFVRRSASNFPDHRELLARIPPRRSDPSLQLYLW